jgi:hypothetical protein
MCSIHVSSLRDSVLLWLSLPSTYVLGYRVTVRLRRTGVCSPDQATLEQTAATKAGNSTPGRGTAEAGVAVEQKNYSRGLTLRTEN